MASSGPQHADRRPGAVPRVNAPAYPAANWLAAVRSLRLPLLTSAALIAINRFVPPAPITSLSLLSIHYLAQIRKRPLQ